MTAHGAKDRPLSRSDEARARLAVTTSPGPFDTLLDLRSLLAQALASIDALRTSLAETAGNLPLFDGADASPAATGYTWTERDVRFELEYAARLDDDLRAMGPVAQDSPATVDVRLNAEWHRVRAGAIRLLVQAKDAAEQWYAADLLDSIPWRRALFHEGPLDDGIERTVSDPPGAIWVATRRSAGELAHLIREVPRDDFRPTPPRPPRDGETIGWYAWDPKSDRFQWHPQLALIGGEAR